MNSLEHAKTPDREPSSENTSRARNVVWNLELVDRSTRPDELRYPHITRMLREHNLLESEVTRVRALFMPELEAFGEMLERDVWEMLTVLELFDPETARHCVDTYHIAKNKVEEPLSTGIVLADYITAEGVTLKTFFISCLLHDIGKIEVPHSIVVNQVSDIRCTELLMAHHDDVLVPALRTHLRDESYILPDAITTGENLLAYLYDTLHIRPQMIAPVRLLLGHMSDEETAEIEMQLLHCGCSLNDTLLTIMRTHDRYSQEILTSIGRPIEGVLAGSHHMSSEGTYTITVGTLRVSVDLAHIIHLADVENAILSMRHYKSGHTPLEALKVLAIHAKRGLVDSYITYLWIADELYKRHVAPRTNDPKEQAHYDFIADFLDSEHSVHITYPDWRIVANTP